MFGLQGYVTETPVYRYNYTSERSLAIWDCLEIKNCYLHRTPTVTSIPGLGDYQHSSCY
jgi:hypothetical protein